jgi:hypothetical protein
MNQKTEFLNWSPLKEDRFHSSGVLIRTGMKVEMWIGLEYNGIKLLE